MLFSLCSIGLMAKTKHEEYDQLGTYNVYDRYGKVLITNTFTYDIYIKSALVNNSKEIYSTICHLTKMTYNEFCEKLKTENTILIGKNIKKFYSEPFDQSFLYKLTHASIKVVRNKKPLYTLNTENTTLEAENSKMNLKNIPEISVEDDNVYTTIDSKIQTLLANLVKKHNIKHEAKETFGVVVNEKFEIICMGNSKIAESNNLQDFQSFLHEPYALASTIKPFTFWAALHYNIITPYTEIPLVFGEKLISGRSMKDTESLGNYAAIDKILYHSSQFGTVAIAKMFQEKNHINFFRDELHFNKPFEVIGLNKIQPFFPESLNICQMQVMSYGYIFRIPMLLAIQAYMLMILGKRGKIRLLRGPEISEKHELSGRKDIAKRLQYVATRSPILSKYGCMVKSGSWTVWDAKKNTFTDDLNNFFFLCIPHKKGFLFCYFGMFENKKQELAMKTVRTLAEEFTESLFQNKFIEPIENKNIFE